LNRHHSNDEIDWKDLKRKPEKLFGFSYFYVLAVLVGIGLLYISNLNSIGRNAVNPTVFPDSAARISDIPLQSPRIIPPVDVLKAGFSSPELIKQGRDLFKANCSSCHGDNGAGEGLSAAMLNPKPRNFHILKDWKNGSKVTQMYKTLEEGIPGSGMASYNYLPPADRFALIHYIRTFANNQPADSIGDLKALDAAYQLAQGMNVAGQIPIKKALRLVVNENIAGAELVHKSVSQLNGSQDPGAVLLKRVMVDEQRVMKSAVSLKDRVRSVDDFIKMVTADPLHSGFKASVIRLSPDEWNRLYHYVFSVVR